MATRRSMRRTTRRAFLGRSGLTAAAMAAAWAAPATLTSAGPGRRLRVGVIGPGGMGSSHLRLLAQTKEVEVTHVCDVDRERLAAAVKDGAASGTTPQGVADLRRILDDRTVDAVFIATPDHWHAPASILALDAGKHVYVEKPCSHNIREGRLMAEAVARSGKVLQVGTQSRSTPCVREAIDRIRAGEIGEVLVAKAWNSQRRSTIGKAQPAEPPPQLDFDAWVGPAPMVPYRRNLLPGIWRWWHDFGCGDIGNDGVHDIDVACWGLGVATHPATAACLGGKYFFDDDQQFPDTQYAVFEYDLEGRPGVRKQLVFEQRIWSPYVQDGYENGAAFYGTKGQLVIGHSVGWKLLGEGNKVIAEMTGSPDLPAHHRNFFACIRGEEKQPAADIAAGHLAASLVHLANIATRVRRLVRFDPAAEQIGGDAEANALVRRRYREGHWAVPRGV